jgi:hypothetical protein
MNAISPTYKMSVVRSGASLTISLLNKRSGEAWDGNATLKFPIGGTGTRARVLVEQPILSLMSCELDTLLRCSNWFWPRDVRDLDNIVDLPSFDERCRIA